MTSSKIFKAMTSCLLAKWRVNKTNIFVELEKKKQTSRRAYSKLSSRYERAPTHPTACCRMFLIDQKMTIDFLYQFFQKIRSKICNINQKLPSISPRRTLQVDAFRTAGSRDFRCVINDVFLPRSLILLKTSPGFLENARLAHTKQK